MLELQIVFSPLSVWGTCVPEDDDLLFTLLPPFVLLQADVAVVLSRVESPADGLPQVGQRPVQIRIQKIGGGLQQSLRKRRV